MRAMDVTLLDWFGYAASVVILVSLMMSSIIKLRWINLVGAVMFATFGFLIGSIPTGSLNLGIAIIDVYYLVRIYRSRDAMAIVPADPHSEYFKYLWRVNWPNIRKIFGDVEVGPEDRAFFYLRNNVAAGILIGRTSDDHTFDITVDYVTPPYRDLRIGQHFITEGHVRTALPGVTRLHTTNFAPAHTTYLRRLGFTELPDAPGEFERSLPN